MDLITQANQIFAQHHPPTVHFERSVFTNWTCAIADCSYCYLSTKPKYKATQGTAALRSQASILAEVIICKLMGWEVGYITGGLRVETAEQLIDLLKRITVVLGKKTMMNYGPYSKPMIEEFAPHVTGMGSAIESFDEALHNKICPSKPLKSLLRFLEDLDGMQKMITIILGLGEREQDVDIVIQNVHKYQITTVQLCFLKPQEGTPFASVPSPDPHYMAGWVARLRIGCPKIQIKVALVRDRIEDLPLYLQAGANAFSRFFAFRDFGPLGQKIEDNCKLAGRQLQGNFSQLPEFNLEAEVLKLPFESALQQQILHKARQYENKLKERAVLRNPLSAPNIVL